MPYENRCETLCWSPLSERRLYISLIECYKTVFELNNLRFWDYFELASKVTRSNLIPSIIFICVTVNLDSLNFINYKF